MVVLSFYVLVFKMFVLLPPYVRFQSVCIFLSLFFQSSGIACNQFVFSCLVNLFLIAPFPSSSSSSKFIHSIHIYNGNMRNMVYILGYRGIITFHSKMKRW